MPPGGKDDIPPKQMTQHSSMSKHEGSRLQSHSARSRRRMIREQIVRRGVRDKAVLDALEAVPRHQFVAADQMTEAYADCPLPIGHKQTISQPYIVAFMTELLQVQPEHTVLEIGTGCGYQTAILAQLARQVVSVEVVPELADSASQRLADMGYRNISVHQGDGRRGWADSAPYDRILVTAAPTKVPDELISQLADNGRMVIPVGITHFHQKLEIISKDDQGQITVSDSIGVRFVPLV